VRVLPLSTHPGRQAAERAIPKTVIRRPEVRAPSRPKRSSPRPRRVGPVLTLRDLSSHDPLSENRHSSQLENLTFPDRHEVFLG
jgi:hypothetical protein